MITGCLSNLMWTRNSSPNNAVKQGELGGSIRLVVTSLGLR